MGQAKLRGPGLGLVNLNTAMEDQSFLSGHCITIVKVPTDQDTGSEGVDTEPHQLVISVEPDPTQIMRELEEEKIIGTIGTCIGETLVEVRPQSHGHKCMIEDRKGQPGRNESFGAKLREIG